MTDEELLWMARNAPHNLIDGGEFALWIENKEMPMAANKELDEAAAALDILTDRLYPDQVVE